MKRPYLTEYQRKLIHLKTFEGTRLFLHVQKEVICRELIKLFRIKQITEWLTK